MKKKKNLTLLYICINIAVIVLIAVLDPNLKEIDKAFYRIKLPWMMGGFLFMLMYWLCDAFITYYSVGVTYEPKSFMKCLKIAMIGQYYSAVTPFASGGQPAQIYYMTKAGIPAGYGSSALMIKFLVYQAVLSIYSLVAFCVMGRFMHHYSTVLFWISLVGFLINAGAIVLIYFLASNKGIVKKIIFKIIDWLHKIKVVKDVEDTRTRLMSHVNDFHSSLDLIKGDGKALFIMLMATALQLTFLFSITYFIYRGFGLNGDRWIKIIFLQSFLYLAVCYFPTPGAAGASEGGFYIFYQLVFPKKFIFLAMFFWRIISYYLNIVVGAVVVFSDSIKGLFKPSVMPVTGKNKKQG
ncbi:lysylphosphatidylglycerol synthase transmembrane domain-containing protein [Xylanivirga thermophila]|uniref:lysylphosphatidylglycerol synthase transmembrane domain-containing protein n=1 Tax=Xylanivirga thermophila TaxID=2496273 RepID=UPI00101C9DAF|nr:lysylphosphatidylglycerol synthase transmembrane domain-containing protein [Xylanivirga thermophila]